MIQVQETPNPNTFKFYLGRQINDGTLIDFSDKEKGIASNIPLVKRIFSLEGVAGVALGSDFVAITKLNDIDWDLLRLEIIQEILAEDDVSSFAHEEEQEEEFFDEADSEIVKRIKEVIDEQVRPAVHEHGGDIKFRGYRNKTVYLKMRGACSGCPSAGATLKDGIANMMTYYFPGEVEEVEEVH